MRKKCPSFVRLLVVLAMVASLLAVTAAPASAVISAVSNTPAPATASTLATQTVAFTTGAAFTTVTVTFPAGTTVPATIATTNVTVTGATDGALTVTAVTPNATARTVLITATSTTAAQVVTAVIGSTTAVINNPPGGSYTLTVATSAEAAVASSAYIITGPGSVTPNPATASAAAGYTVNIRTTVNIPLGGTITLTFPTGTTLPSTIVKAYVSVAGRVWVATDADPVVSGQNVTITIPTTGGALAAGSINVVISQGAGIKNPPIAATAASNVYIMSVSTSAEGAIGTLAYQIVPGYTISAATGARGTAVTVTGVGWTPNTSVVISTGLVGTGSILADGTFSVSALATQTGAVNCADGAGNTDTTWGLTAPTITMLPTVSASPTTVNPGGQATVSGWDFTSGGTITASTGIKLGGTNWGPASSITLSSIDAYGSSDDFTTTLATRWDKTGSQVVSVTDGTLTATTSLTVTAPTITVNPTSGAPNTWVTISGSNWPASQTIAANALTLGGNAWNTASAISIDASGNWSTTLRVLAAAGTGSNQVYASVTDTSAAALGTASAITLFTVGQAAITVTPDSGPRGTQVTVTADNMTIGGSTVTAPAAGYPAAGLYFAQSDWNTTANGGGTTITVTSSGTMSPTSLRVPATGGVVGANTIFAKDAAGATAVGTFTITQPTMTASATSGSKGDTITLTGAGWVPGTLGLVTVTFTPAGGSAQTLLTATPDSVGGWIAQFAVPLTALATNQINATDTNYNNSATPITLTLGAATISVDPSSGPIGTEVTITGSGFTPQSGVSSFTIGTMTMSTVGLATDTLGGLSAVVNIPGLAQGSQTITLTVGTDNPTTFFTVSAAPPTVATALSSVSDELVRVWGYYAGEWQMYDPADVVGSDLSGLTEGRGYWVKATAACTVVYLGKSRSLEAGWTLMGW